MKIKNLLMTGVLAASLLSVGNAQASGDTLYVDSKESSWFSDDSVYTDREFSLDLAESMFRIMSGDGPQIEAFTKAVKAPIDGVMAFDGANACTAFLVKSDIAFTAAHCFFKDGVRLDSTVAMSFTEPTKVLKAEVIHIDRLNDIAAIRLPKQDHEPIPMATSIPSSHSKAIVLGFPGTIWLPFKNFQLTSVETTVRPEWFTMYSFDKANIVPKLAIQGQAKKGNSGGPIVNDRGELIGIVNAIYPAYDVTLAAKQDVIHNLMEVIIK